MQRMNYELIRRLAAKTDATLIKWGHSQAFLPFFLLWALIRSLCMLPSKKRPNVIYLGDALLAPLGLLLKIILRRPVAVTAHGRDLTFRFPLYRFKIGFSLRRLDLVIGVSRYTTDIAKKMRVDSSRCVTINNGVDIEECTPTSRDEQAAKEWLARKEITPDRPLLITVGRLVKRKGIEPFIRNTLPLLLSSHPSLLYIVIGEGKEKPSIETAIHETGLSKSAILAGGIPRGTIRGLMKPSKVFVMPNVPIPGDVEGFGLVAVEAGCAGLPVVASDIEGIRDAVIDGQNGFLIPHDNHALFARTIIKLLSDERQRTSTGERARKFVLEACSWDMAAGKYLDKFKLLVDSSNPQTAS